ncbi:hypothetical protein [Gemmata sp.]|uniref:hypothetical protein n=1 Tax=Gemmata sp. TaxID=1914242 RepID=UPI003F722587
MYPLLAFAGAYGPNIASWLLAHSGELGDAAARIARPVMAAITDPSSSLDRIGSALVAQNADRQEVIGLLHQHTTQLDGISAAVVGVGQAVGHVGQAVGVLTSLTMVGLGVAALSQAHIAFQFARLTERLKRLEAEVQEIKETMHAGFRGEMSAGLIKLKSALDAQAAAPDRADALFRQAINNLTDSMAKYVELLRGGLGSRNPHTEWVLARHLTVSTLGQAAAHTRLGEPGSAVQALRFGLPSIREHTRAVFRRTVGEKPGTFLMPALSGHGITLDVLAELCRQAGHAGVLEKSTRVTASDVFESLRDRLLDVTDPWFFKTSKVERLRAEFAEASAAVEEVNRIEGLALTIEQCERTGHDHTSVVELILRAIEACRPDEGACFAVFPPLD